jgi:galactokinase
VTGAPGRVNLIGEHTDYNGGYVLPFAIDRFTEAVLRPRHDRKIRVYSTAFQEETEFELPLRDPAPTGRWDDYLKGILVELALCSGGLSFGFDGVIQGNLPIGGGLSSSASLEIALALGLSQLYEIELEDLMLIELCQRAENEFVGANCGIMDQYVSLLAREGSALLLDVAALQHRYVPLGLEGVFFLVIDSGVRRALTNSGYNERRQECQQALLWLQGALLDRRISSLRDVGHKELEKMEGAMPSPLWQRAMHVIVENERVLQTVAALERDDAPEVGRLLSASHASLRDLFEVSTPGLDFLVDWATGHGALGARLVGGGFGGVTLHLVPAEVRTKYTAGICRAYERNFGLKLSVLEVHPGPGARCNRNLGG